jgi:F0F1-type ATP synthase membrane subunit c/vacuolar-type H+-ATPase subunit K
MLFVKAAKVIAFATLFTPITGLGIATGMIYSSLLRGIAYAPELEDTLFAYASLAFAFVETFMFIIIFASVVVFAY